MCWRRMCHVHVFIFLIYHFRHDITEYWNDILLKVALNIISLIYIIPLYNVYSTYIEIRLVETIPRDIYQNIVFPLFEILKI